VPVVSTTMIDVPWPELIVPAETVQWYVGWTFGSPPLKVRSLPLAWQSAERLGC